MIGENPSIPQSGVHDKKFYNSMWKSIEKHGKWQGEIWNRRKTGELYPEWLSIMPVTDANGEITNYCGIFTDLLERKHVESMLKKRALIDSLTMVSNRFAYIERVKNLLESTPLMKESIQHY